ncbi:MAG: GerMN domain-containing protein, partial [Clostridia bacterium]|nr:GerMN domain-containing protein [Clostridia bacterium]
MRKKALLSGILCACLTLSGCVSSVQPSGGQVTLPPSYVSYTAPTGDSDIRRDQVVKLYVPDVDGIRLVPVDTTVSLNPFRWYAQELAEALFDYEGPEGQQFPGYESLFLNNVNPVEVSCGIATVNLNTAALSLSHEDLYTVFQALTNTLCQFGDIHGVNLLIGGVQPGIDVASQSPAGTLSENLTDDLSALWARAASVREAAAANRRITSTATLYFPAVSGAGVLAESRALVFQNASIPRLARTLLEAISEGPRDVHAKAVPGLADQLSTLPSVTESGGERILTLRFSKELTARLQENGIPLSCLAASLCLTMTTFLPGVSGVTIYIGTERLNSLTQEGTYQGAGTTLAFPGGVMR